MGNYAGYNNPIAGLAQAAQDRAMQPSTQTYWPDNPGVTPPPQFLGPPVHTSPHVPPGFLGPPIQQPPRFLGPPQQQGGFGFQMPPPPAPDLYAAGRFRQKQQQNAMMDPARALAIQEMGKYLQQWGKLHQQHGSLQEALHGMGKPQGR